ncbi:MAG: IPT/TIG domain-containing protein [Nostoc sp. DedQUE12a]|nr:IPT/TIG domain-containing protein [Nostoc sp. DedQUE12a]
MATMKILSMAMLAAMSSTGYAYALETVGDPAQASWTINSPTFNFMLGQQPKPGVDDSVPNPIIAKPGDTVTITGRNLKLVKKIFIGKKEIKDFKATDTEIKFTVPDLPLGKYPLDIEDENAVYKGQKIEIVAGTPKPAPDPSVPPATPKPAPDPTVPPATPKPVQGE